MHRVVQTFCKLRAIRLCSANDRFSCGAAQAIASRSSTDFTPGADHAAFSTAYRSSQLPTVPSNKTLSLSRTITRMPLASTSACRFKAFQFSA